jgi:hypothetical protein
LTLFVSEPSHSQCRLASQPGTRGSFCKFAKQFAGISGTNPLQHFNAPQGTQSIRVGLDQPSLSQNFLDSSLLLWRDLSM